MAMASSARRVPEASGQAVNELVTRILSRREFREIGFSPGGRESPPVPAGGTIHTSIPHPNTLRRSTFANRKPLAREQIEQPVLVQPATLRHCRPDRPDLAVPL